MYSKLKRFALTAGVLFLTAIAILDLYAQTAGENSATSAATTTTATATPVRQKVEVDFKKFGIDPAKVVVHQPISTSAVPATPTLLKSSAATLKAAASTTAVTTVATANNDTTSTSTTLTEVEFDSTTWTGWTFYTSLPEASQVRWHVTNSPAGSDWDAAGYETNRALFYGNPYTRDFDYSGYSHDGWARSPIINVPQAEKVTIQWRDWHKGEDYQGGDYDSCYFYVHDLDTGTQHLLTHWYAIYSGNPYQPYWVTYNFDISAVAGHRIQVYLLFTTLDGLYNRVDAFGQRVYGWFIDDIIVEADQKIIYEEPFGDESRAGSNVTITDKVATANNLTIDESSISTAPDSKLVGEDGNTTLTWTIPKISLDETVTISFLTNLKNLIPNEVRVVNQGLEMTYLTVAGNTATETLGPQSVRVEMPIDLKVDVEKLQYFANEDAKVDVAFTLGANSVHNIAESKWAAGTLNNTSAEFAAGKLSLAVAETHNVASPLQNGTFEENNTTGWGNNNLWCYTSSSSPLSGQYSLVSDFSGVGYFYQDLAIPEGIYSAKLTLLDYKESRESSINDEYKIEIRNPSNPDTILKTLYFINSKGWSSTARSFDLTEFAGQNIRLAFYVKSYNGTLMKWDDIALEIKSYTFAESGTARYLIDAESTVSWDKIQIASTLPEGTSYTVKARGADSSNDLAQAEFVPQAVSNNEITVNLAPSRYLELELELATTNTATTPLLESIKTNYFKVQDGEQLRLKVFILDSGNAVVKELTNYAISPSQGRQQTLPLIFNTANNAPGNYSAKGVIYLNEQAVIEDSDFFEIVAEEMTQVASGLVTTDRLEYTPADNILITSTVLNESANVQLQNIGVSVMILNADNEVVKTFDPYTINMLLANSQNRKSLTVPAGELATGNYTVRQEITMGSEVVSRKEAAFTVVDSVVQGKGIAGTLTPQPLIVKRRIGDLSILANATNTGNADLSGVSFRVRIYDAAGQTVLKEFTGTGDLPKAGPAYAQTHPYGAKVELMPGTYPMVLTAEFTYNGEAMTIPLDTRGFIVTNTPPVANAGADITTTTTSRTGIPITLNGSGSTDENSTDEAKKNDIVSYEWKHGETVLGTGETLTTNLSAGVYDITLTVTDTCGAKHSDTVKVTITQILLPPTITDLNPVHNTITKELGLSAKATDEIWGIDWTTLVFKAGTTVLPANYDAETGAITASLPADAADGWYDLNIYIKNQGGAGATTPEWKVGLDRTPPVISDLAPEADVFTNNAKPTISATVTDAFAGIDPATVKVSIGDTVLESSYDAETGKVTAVIPSNLADGWHDAKIEAADKVGNTATATWRVGVDVTPPTISNMTPVADSEINQSSQEISMTVTDALSGVKADSIVLKLDNAVVTHSYDAETGKVLFNAENLTDGIHSVNITVSDNAGNESSATWQFNVQLRVPGSEYLLFHNSQNGQLDISGGNKTINGMAHSNANIKVRGNNTTITGQTTAVGTISVNGKDHNIALQQSGAPEVAMPVYPYEYYVANATYTYNGSKTFGKGETIPDGIHLVNGDVTVQGDINGNITIVATGSISVKSQTVNLTYADTKYKVALYSRDGNISFTSNGVTVKGVIYAPNGECKVSSSTSTFTGAIVADVVDISGQDMTLNPLDYGTENNGGVQ